MAFACPFSSSPTALSSLLPFIILAYLVLINLVGFIVFLVDKRKAKNHSWRVPEKVLHIFELLGSFPSIFVAMYMFRHKNKKFSYYVWTYLFAFLWLAVLFYFFFFF